MANLTVRSYHTRPARHGNAWLVAVNVVMGLLALSAWGWIFALAYLSGLA